MSELKPCPFCGCKRISVESIENRINQFFTTVYFLCCQNMDCHTEGPADLGESGAIEKWNTRAECAEPSAQAEEMHI